MSNSVRRSAMPEYKTLPAGHSLSETLHFDLDGYCAKEEVRNGFVTGALKRVRIEPGLMRKLPDGRWEATSEKWEALELLEFTFNHTFYMGEGVEVKREIRVAARTWDEADRIYKWNVDQWMHCGLISGWRNF